MSSPMNYDVSVSFAGENREYVEKVAQALRAANVRVFYDAYEEVALWGRDLYQHLARVYSTSRYCVIFVSEAYARKVWTRHELRNAQARALNEQREYILPARFDATQLPGLPPSIAYIDLSTKTPEELAQLILRKLAVDAGRGDSEQGSEFDAHFGAPPSIFSETAVSKQTKPVSSPLPNRHGWPLRAVAVTALIASVLIGVYTFYGRWTDQRNCSSDERWVGMNPHKTEWTGRVTPDQAKRATFHGELRWAPEVDRVRKTTAGRVELEVDGRTTVIHRWNSPPRSTYSFTVRVDKLLVGTSGRFKIRWIWEDGTSGVCVATSDIKG